jgi:predicted heme/steroid binding protein
MTREELAAGDGRDGRPALVAVRGKVYDFSASPMWAAGDHQGEHQAGTDLTEALLKAPHVRAVIERFPVVGELEEESQEPEKGGSGRIWIGLSVLLLAGLLFWLLLR